MSALSLAAHSLEPETPIDLLALASSAEIAATIRDALSVSGDTNAQVLVGDLRTLLQELRGIATPKTLVVDFGDDEYLINGVSQLADVCDPHVQVFVVGSVNDLNLYRALIEVGVAEYLLHPLTADALTSALRSLDEKLSEPSTAGVGNEPGVTAPVVGIVPVRGGAGASTVAANLAWVSAQASRETVLIDMNITFGTQALLFDVDPGGGLTDAMNSPERLDDLFVKRAAIKVRENLRIIAAEADIATREVANVPALRTLISHVRGSTSALVVDLPRNLVQSEPEISDVLDKVVLVSTPTLVAMRDSTRISNLLRSHRPDIDIEVVLNKCGAVPRYQLESKTFVEGIGHKILAELPFDAKTSAAAEAQASCIVQANRKTKLGKALTKLGSDVFREDATDLSNRKKLNLDPTRWLRRLRKETPSHVR